jgi:hypothetical protein
MDVMDLLAGAWPSFRPDGPLLKVWARKLMALPYAVAEQAVDRVMGRGGPFAPSLPDFYP